MRIMLAFVISLATISCAFAGSGWSSDCLQAQQQLDVWAKDGRMVGDLPFTVEDYIFFSGALARGCDKEAAELLERRRVQAMERAAATAEHANRIEAHRICLRLTGRLCPVGK